MKLLTKLTALLAGIAVLGSAALVANAAPKMGGKMKSKSHMSTMGKTKTVHVKGYTRHLKNGKTVKVKPSVRHITMKPKMKAKSKTKM